MEFVRLPHRHVHRANELQKLGSTAFQHPRGRSIADRPPCLPGRHPFGGIYLLQRILCLKRLNFRRSRVSSCFEGALPFAPIPRLGPDRLRRQPAAAQRPPTKGRDR
jgi:hypothetical protein